PGATVTDETEPDGISNGIEPGAAVTDETDAECIPNDMEPGAAMTDGFADAYWEIDRFVLDEPGA
ncbi:hypothetical protein ACVBEF_21360, partial [Glaciimonas sp. GG7]